MNKLILSHVSEKEFEARKILAGRNKYLYFALDSELSLSLGFHDPVSNKKT